MNEMTEVVTDNHQTANDIEKYRQYAQKRIEQGLDFETFSEFAHPDESEDTANAID